MEQPERQRSKQQVPQSPGGSGKCSGNRGCMGAMSSAAWVCRNAELPDPKWQPRLRTVLKDQALSKRFMGITRIASARLGYIARGVVIPKKCEVQSIVRSLGLIMEVKYV